MGTTGSFCVRVFRMIHLICSIAILLDVITTGIGEYCCSNGTTRTAPLITLISAFSLCATDQRRFNGLNRGYKHSMRARNHICAASYQLQKHQRSIQHLSSSGLSKFVIGASHQNVPDFCRHLVAHYSCNNNDNCKSDSYMVTDRRSFLQKASTAVKTTAVVSTLVDLERADAEIVDATDLFTDNDWSPSSSSTRGATSKNGLDTNNDSQSKDTFAPTDEIPIRINRKTLQQNYNNRLGLELVDIEFRTNLRVRVKSVQEGSYAASKELQIQPDWIMVSINGRSMERTNAAGVRQYLIEAIQQPIVDDIIVEFRDPSKFQSQLRDMSIASTNQVDDTIPTVTTQIGPRGDTTQRNKDGSVKSGQLVTTADADQRITVQQLQKKSAICTHGADIDDLLEISYTGTVVETGQMFDGSAIFINNQGIPGRGNDISLFFVLGKQPLGQFPPGWDVGLIGMCAGERRRVIIPPALAYGNKGMVRRNIPPNATLQYDITLISINGLAI